jgi:hypothetical protein
LRSSLSAFHISHPVFYFLFSNFHILPATLYIQIVTICSPLYYLYFSIENNTVSSINVDIPIVPLCPRSQAWSSAKLHFWTRTLSYGFLSKLITLPHYNRRTVRPLLHLVVLSQSKSYPTTIYTKESVVGGSQLHPSIDYTHDLRASVNLWVFPIQ